MPIFELQNQEGKTFELDAPDMQSAVSAFKKFNMPAPVPGVTADPNPPLLPGERPLTVGPDRAAAGFGGTAPTAGESAVRGARAGATFNWGDELAGAAAASPLPGKTDQPDINAVDTILGALRLGAENVAPSVFGQKGHEAYQAAIDRERQANEAAKTANPNAFLGGELAGGIGSAAMAPMLTPFKAPAAAGVIRTALTAAPNLALTGGVYGGVAGAGGADGDLADRAAGAAYGAGGGAVLGPVVGGAAGFAGAVGRGAANQVRAFTNPTALGNSLLTRNLRYDTADLPAAIQQMREGQAQGQLLTLGDIGGRNTQGLAGSVLRNPGEARTPAQDFVVGRQEGIEPTSRAEVISQGDRVTQKVGDLLSHQGLLSTTKNLIAQRAADSTPLYEAAHIKPINYDTFDGRALLDTLERLPPSAKNAANRLLQYSNEGGNQVIWKQMGDSYQMVAVPNMRRFDYIKQGIDDAIGSPRGKFGRYDNEQRALIRFKNKITEHLDNLVPEYKAARQMFAGHSELLDALEEGGKIWEAGYSKEKLAETLKGMTDGEKAMLRVAAADKLLNKIENMPDAADKARSITRSDAYREKMRMIAPDQKSYETLKSFLANETAMHKTYAEMGNSKTAERLAREENSERIISAGRMIVSAGVGHFKSFAYEAFRHLGRISPERRSAVMEAVRHVVLNPDPAVVEKFMNTVYSSATTPSNAKQFIRAVVNTLPRTTVTDTAGRRQEAH